MQAAERIQQPVRDRVGVHPRHGEIQQQLQRLMVVEAVQPLRGKPRLHPAAMVAVN